jgi:hypothetical protein
VFHTEPERSLNQVYTFCPIAAMIGFAVRHRPSAMEADMKAHAGQIAVDI